MENKYITVAYKLYVMQDGQKTLVEEATVEHPFQFISGLGTTLERFETEITALKKGDKFKFDHSYRRSLRRIYARRCAHCI